jgi:general L-amino acid transport system substrate-binding protein
LHSIPNIGSTPYNLVAIDVLSRNSTSTMSREVEPKLVFPALPVAEREIRHVKVCVQGGTTTELNLGDYLGTNNMKLERIRFASGSEAAKGYDAGRCDVFTNGEALRHWRRAPNRSLRSTAMRPDLTPDEIVMGLHKRGISGSRSAAAPFPIFRSSRHYDITI